jgi:superfamily II DNA or RNA helicase
VTASLPYVDFLETKRDLAWGDGPTVEAEAIHPLLYEWQARIVQWACHKGSAAIFADCGLGKTFMQLEWARLVADKALIVAPLSVARQTVREASRLGLHVHYIREQRDVGDGGIYITNYEMLHAIDPRAFGAVVLDESSILKNVDAKTRQLVTAMFGSTRYRLACTATPAPNDVAELCNHAAFLGVMTRADMLAAYFVHDDDGWRPKGHAVQPMFRWMASWAVAARKPSDIGGSDEGYGLPPLSIGAEVVAVDVKPAEQLFATELGGIGGRAKVRRATLAERVKRSAQLCEGDEQAILWCALNDESDQAARLIEGAVNVEGSWTAEAKAAALEAFQDGAIRVLVTKPRIAGFGMNFQNCARMIFCGLGDSYEAYYQAIRRCWRFGQKRPVDVRIIVSELEQEIVRNVQSKEAEANLMTAGLVAAVDREWRA